MLKRWFIFFCFALIAGVTAVAADKPNRVVLGYSACWFDDQFPPENYNFGTITYLARAFLEPHSDGSIGVPANYFDSKMEELARQHGVRLLMSLGGEAEKADNWLSIARHPKYLDRFLDTLGQLMKEHGYDGVDIDWEPTALTDEDGAAYISLLKSLRQRFPGAIITTALPAEEYWVSHFSWPDVWQNVDYINVMVYCYGGAWAGKATYTSNLGPPEAYPPQRGYSADEGMHNLIDRHHVPVGKLLYGVTFWGLRFNVNHFGDPFPKNTRGYCYDISYWQATALANSGLYNCLWDNGASMPYMMRNNGGSVVCYEDAASMALKCLDAKKLGCAGVMIWHLGADQSGLHTPLMDAIAQGNGVESQALPPEMLEKQVDSVNEQIADTKAKLQRFAPKIRLNVAQPAVPDMNSSPRQSDDGWNELIKNWGVASDQLWQVEELERKKP